MTAFWNALLGIIGLLGFFAGALILCILAVVFKLVDAVDRERRGDHDEKR